MKGNGFFSFFGENGINYKFIEIKEFMNYETMFAQSTALKGPWKIEKAEFDGYSCMTYLVVGKLKLTCPKLFTV